MRGTKLFNFYYSVPEETCNPAFFYVRFICKFDLICLPLNNPLSFFYRLFKIFLEKRMHKEMGQYSVYRNFPKFSDRHVWANSVDPDQTAPL